MSTMNYYETAATENEVITIATKTMILGLCLCVFALIGLSCFILGYAGFLNRRNNRLEHQNEYKTELIIQLNNKIEELERYGDD